MVNTKRLASIAALLGLVTAGVTAMPRDAKAWWRHGVWIAPVVVAPPPVYYARPPVVVVAPPPPYYVAPRRVWIPGALVWPVLGPRSLGLIAAPPFSALGLFAPDVTIECRAIDEAANRVHR